MEIEKRVNLSGLEVEDVVVLRDVLEFYIECTAVGRPVKGAPTNERLQQLLVICRDKLDYVASGRVSKPIADLKSDVVTLQKAVATLQNGQARILEELKALRLGRGK